MDIKHAFVLVFLFVFLVVNSISAQKQLGEDIIGIGHAHWGSRLAMSSDGYTIATSGWRARSGEGNNGEVAVFQWADSFWLQKGQIIVGDEVQFLGAELFLSTTGDTLICSTGWVGNAWPRIYAYYDSEDEWRRIDTINGQDNNRKIYDYAENAGVIVGSGGNGATSSIYCYFMGPEGRQQWGNDVPVIRERNDIRYKNDAKIDNSAKTLVSVYTEDERRPSGNDEFFEIYNLKDTIWELDTILPIKQRPRLFFDTWYDISGDGNTLVFSGIDGGSSKLILFFCKKLDGKWQKMPDSISIDIRDNSNYTGELKLNNEGNRIFISFNSEELNLMPVGTGLLYESNSGSWQQVGAPVFGNEAYWDVGEACAINDAGTMVAMGGSQSGSHPGSGRFSVYDFSCEGKHVIDERDVCRFDELQWIDGNIYEPNLLERTRIIYFSQTINGCDSLIELKLNIGDRETTEITIDSCDAIWFDSTFLEDAGPYRFNYTSQYGCDSVVSVYFNRWYVNTQVTQFQADLLSNEVNADYQWVTCPDYSPVQGATDRLFIAEESGEYAVIVEKGGCTDTSECYTVLLSSMHEQEEQDYSVFPNPVSEKLQVGHIPFLSFQLLNSAGLEVMNGSNQAEIDFSGLLPGVYFLKLTFDQSVSHYFKVLKTP